MMSSKPVKFEVTKVILWDNWGSLVTAFREGDIVEGEMHEDGSITAESTVYEGIYDDVDLDCIRIISE